MISKYLNSDGSEMGDIEVKAMDLGALRGLPST